MDGTAWSDGGSEEQLELLAAVMADPVRARIFLATAEPELMVDGGAGGITIRQVSAIAGEPRRRVRYHMDVLCEQGLVEVVAEKRRGGVVERLYRSACLPFLSVEDIAALPLGHRQKIVLETLKFIFSDATAAVEAESFMRRPEFAAVHIRAQVDEEGWKELAAAHERLRRESDEILAAAKKRLQLRSEQAMHITSAILLFELPPLEPVPRPDRRHFSARDRGGWVRPFDES
jgi:DNA-binding transcriptional ArsR family regulator